MGSSLRVLDSPSDMPRICKLDYYTPFFRYRGATDGDSGMYVLTRTCFLIVVLSMASVDFRVASLLGKVLQGREGNRGEAYSRDGVFLTSRVGESPMTPSSNSGSLVKVDIEHVRPCLCHSGMALHWVRSLWA